jgi:hypothetical protein
MDADDPDRRRQTLVEAVVAARRDGCAVTFAGADARVTYEDRTLRLDVDADQRSRLDDLLAEYSVFKVAQPATRKASEGVVYLSAITDPKHAADFLEAVFREVYGAPEGYELRVE